MKLPYPFENGDRLITSVELRKPNGGTLADARKHAENGDVYQALLAYVAGSVAALVSSTADIIEGREPIKAALRGLPWTLAEWIAFRSMVLAGAEEELDFAYQCPRCGATRYEEEHPIKVTDLVIKESDAPPTALAELPDPIEFKDAKTKEVIESVSTIKFRLPTVGDCISASSSVGNTDDTRLQYAIWAKAIIEVNGTAIDHKWRGTWGSQLFERMEIDGLRAVTKALGEWSIDSTVPATCKKCGKSYKQGVPTSTFFASALRGD